MSSSHLGYGGPNFSESDPDPDEYDPKHIRTTPDHYPPTGPMKTADEWRRCWLAVPVQNRPTWATQWLLDDAARRVK